MAASSMSMAWHSSSSSRLSRIGAAGPKCLALALCRRLILSASFTLPPTRAVHAAECRRQLLVLIQLDGMRLRQPPIDILPRQTGLGRPLTHIVLIRQESVFHVFQRLKAFTHSV